MVNRRSANEKTKMKIQYVSIKPTQKAEESGCYAFIPEMLASVGARYSRNNEGLDAIVDKLDPNNQEKSIDNIFKYTDFGHASIADMAPIALFIDDITLYAAYFLWTLSPTAGGQECSTRYIKMDSSNVASTDDLGIYDQYEQQYDLYVAKSFNYYEEALKKFGDRSILVFSDDIEWCKKQKIFTSRNCNFVENNSKIYKGHFDLCLLSMCNDFIIANSTFTWWGSWLSKNKNKKVIAPKEWFGPELKHNILDDQIPEEWERI